MTKTLIEPDSWKRFGENKVSFITFNYDRSLEHFLYDSLINSFQIPHSSVKVDDYFPFKFLHVYGKIADLPWQGNNGIPYRHQTDIYKYINRMMDNIRIIYDIDTDDNHIKELRETIRKAKRIFFLGFGFAKENMDILGIPSILHHQPKTYATVRGWTENEILGIRHRLLSGFKNSDPGKNNPYVKSFDCHKLLREYL